MSSNMGTDFNLRTTLTSDQALSIFDGLEPVNIDFMLGQWKGGPINTNHPLDGLLELASWHGKHFESADIVFPLVHCTAQGKKFNVQPALMPMGLLMRYPSIKKILSKRLFLSLRFLFGCQNPTARIRMMEFRGKTSATMIYDRQPINDIFRKLDDNTVMGVMDLKCSEQLFFFTLMREQ